MSLSRAELAAELWGRLQRPFAEVGITNSDTTGNLKEPLDATLSALGVAYADLGVGVVQYGDELKAITVAVYYGYAAMLDAVSTRVTRSLSAASPQVSRTDNFTDLTRTLEAAMARAKAAALPYLPAEGSWGYGTISLGFIEPEACEA